MHTRQFETIRDHNCINNVARNEILNVAAKDNIIVAVFARGGCCLLVVGRQVFPKLLWHIAQTGSRELFTLCVVAAAVSIAYAAAKLFGVSFSLGAFFAGVVMRGVAVNDGDDGPPRVVSGVPQLGRCIGMESKALRMGKRATGSHAGDASRRLYGPFWHFRHVRPLVANRNLNCARRPRAPQ